MTACGGTQEGLRRADFFGKMRSMGAIKINFEGMDITVGNADDLAATVRALQGLKGQRATDTPAPRQMSLVPNDVSRDNTKVTIAFLESIVGAGDKGSEADQIMRAVGIDKPKALGGVSVRVNNVLLKHQFKPEDVYSNRRPTDGSPRTWKSGHRIQEALESLRKAL
jgi:hypothetical protein